MYKMNNGKSVSYETVELALQAHFKANPEPKPKFKPISCYQFRIAVPDLNKGFPILIGFNKEFGSDSIMYLPYTTKSVSAVGELIEALLSAKAFVEANK